MPAMGVTRVATVTGLDCIGIPVVMVCRPNSRSLAVSQGKGLDIAAARASGLMESAELYHAEHITLPLKLCSYRELLALYPVVDPAVLPQPQEGLFHPDQPLLWIEGHDLLRHEPVWVPYDLVHANYTLAHLNGPRSFLASSAGLAAGNHPLEAISQGICELVERDASALWTLQDWEGRNATRIDLDTVDDESCRGVLEQFERAGVAVAVWETTSDIGIPAFWCEIEDREKGSLHRFPSAGGMGCHPARHIALLRALTEAAQSRLTVITGSRDDMGRRMYERSLTTDMAPEHPIWAGSNCPMRPFPGPSWDGETFEEDVAWELGRLHDVGIERVIVVDLTGPELQLPVVRVVIPGLETYRENAVRARLGPRARRLVEARA
jgi:ribosomal protein S12 methylthiotransferase accessory factor